MTACNFRSLLLAAIVISNCISWTTSRHHYTHNVHQHRTRHRRQGAGLFLSASYVIPGGEGGGAWGEWGEVSPCSRTCGGGVASQKRICLQISPDGQPQCSGGDTKYFSCQTQDCPSGAIDFRAEQCAEFDDKDFRGYRYNWVPYTKAPNPCELNCMPHGERFYFRHKLKVTDGTRCNDESFDVCVNGSCQPVGCDMMLGSNAREDKCRECRGNGTNCHTSSGIFDSQDLVKGYNDILLIPQGSTTIIIEEIEPSNNYLALRAKNGTYYLNGHYHIDFPRTILIAGALWTYERSQQGYAAPDKLRCLGPTSEPLYLSLLLQDTNVGIRYEYSIPNNTAPPTDKRYNWVHEKFTPCSATCGGGFQTRNVTCRSREELEIVDDSLCDQELKPPSNQTCNPDPCPPQWVEGPWGNCSKKCGSDGVSSREVTCQQIIANGLSSIVPDKKCFDLLGPKPELFQKCNQDAPCPTWFVGHWKPCDKLCDEGKQTRQVVCYQNNTGRIEILDDEDCTDEKPELEQPCMLKPCDGVDWVVTDWSGCDTCLSKVRTRLVLCTTKYQKVLNDSFCSYHKRPADREECDVKQLPKCEVQWYATQWSKCSVDCGEGVQTRKVFCGLYDGDNVEVVADDKCADLPKYNDTKPCSVPKEKCPAQWFAGPWSACTKECGGGERDRRVMCMRGDENVADCDGSDVLDTTEICNMQPCDEDETLPVDSKSTPIMDEEEECDYDGDYPEVGLDADSLFGTTLDMMLSDSPGYAEFESTLKETGSGMESTLSTEELTTFEGSGFGSTGSTFSTDYESTTDDSIIDTDSTYSTGTGSTTDSSESTATSEAVEGSATTPISDTGATGETTSSGTGETSTTESSPTDETGSTITDGTGSTSADNTSSTGSSAMEETGSTPTDSTGSTESASTDASGSTSSDGISSARSKLTVSTKSTIPDVTDRTTDGTGLTSLDITGSTESSATDGRDSTLTDDTSLTGSDEIASTDVTSSTEETISTGTEETGSTESTITAASGSTEVKGTGSTGTEETATTVTGETSSTETSDTEPTESTESTVSSETDSTGTDDTTESESTISTITETTESSASSETTEPRSVSSTRSTLETSTSSETTELGSTASGSSGVTDITTESGSSISSESTDLSSTVAAASTRTTSSQETKKTTLSGTTEISESTDTEGSTIALSTESSGSSETTEPSTGSSESTIETSTSSGSESTSESGSTISTSESLESSTVESSTSESESTVASSSSGSDSTIESSTSSGSIETTELSSSGTTESSSDITGISTVSRSEITTETGVSGSTISSETTEEGSSTTSGVTEHTTAETTESTVKSSSTTEGTTGTESTEVSGSTTEGLSTTEGSTSESVTISRGRTTWGLSSTLGRRKPAACKPHRKPKCDKSEFGCCPDKKTAAAGPFDEGCLKPRTCKESLYGCCPDGLSPALGDNNEGCPVEPCADTLFGCCLSDNKTAAQGNDQDGCPPPPPACASSEFGCCADNETKAGPEKEGCPETETTSTPVDTETTAGTTEYTQSSGTSDTSESSTASEGSTGVTGSTPTEICASFKFGCCGDNETEATGPDGQGCPCNATEFGCCPDGVSPAQGVEMEGCPGHCSTSQHGCCQDNKTPAHGPEFEGCCLLQAFGCCPDNRKPAEGPHLEGCGCQHTVHGCCPDNVTAAQGPDNKGCGCVYTEHGCCPDRHTEASGPNYEGCSCSTFQFGCCEDGVTSAKGPDQQGCRCIDSNFGCCGDGETPATGPDAAGCDCSSGKYGCCPDGHTEATGPKFLGCTDAPENKQAVCSLPTDAGPCHNFTAVWFYDLAYGGCSRFWYGGCEGNGNRFATKEDCEDVCVQPAPRDACKLPSVKGPCDGDYVRWHYNSSREQCIPFRYGGCLGNANNFDTRDLCQAQCEPARTTGQCNLPIEQGPCAGSFSRWGFNSETHTCEQFTWGGCEGNGNRFKTKAACQLHCDPPGALKPECTEQQDSGTCGGKVALWSFSQPENRCVPFYYSGCGGNGNRFESRETCEQTCPSAYVPDKCTLPAETGECSNYRERWFYDTTNKRCRGFYYGGCGGNENNFVTEAECERACSEVAPLATTTTTVQPQVQPQPKSPQRPQRPETELERPDFCLLAIDPGPCTNTETKYAYDSDLGRCRTFEYGGCGGNRNNFPDETYCTAYCHPVQDICQLPMLSGPCEESLMRWFYDSATDSCSQFTYGGCEGNDNRFDSLEACESRCKTGPPETALKTTKPPPRTVETVPAECRISEALEECNTDGEVWYFDQSSRECVAYSNQETGRNCRHTGTFKTQEACERSCGAFLGLDVCQQRLDPGPCGAYVTKVYFDAAAGECREFAYGGCLGGANRFSTIEECTQVCKPESDPCSLPPEQGDCYSYTRQWYYDASRGQCYEFMYTGCNGNENRFETQGDCEARCKRPAHVTTTTPASVIPPQIPQGECITPSSLAPCGENVTVFYYDSNKRQCLASGFGNCRHPNSYNTEEECERKCGAFNGINVCDEPLDPGPCRASIPKFYWDTISASCQPFAYGGCIGGPNRFSTIAECQDVCGDTGPARECLQAVDIGEGCARAPPVMRWHYSAAHGACRVFAYQGCGGNDNNFRSYEQCLNVCGLSTIRGDDSNEVLPRDCQLLRQECEALDCQYGIDRVIENGCERCKCVEDPCVTANCPPSERCVASAVRDPATGEPRYSATCITEIMKPPECARYAAECASLDCEYGVQRSSTPEGCERCACAPPSIDCTPLEDECRRQDCQYGMDTSVGPDGCTRCKCKEHPCATKSCATGERCVVVTFRNGVDQEPKYMAECRTVEKPGVCPPDEPSNEVLCHDECVDDAECRGVGKCCSRGCSRVCLAPAEPTTTFTPLTTTYAPDVPAPPQAIAAREPQVSAAEGGTATLRCLFHGNPPPKITWRRGELTIDGSVGRYRLTSDGALEIVSLYRNDTGVYICVADNGLGVARQEIHLVVNDPVRSPVGIAGDENAVVTGDLGKPLVVRCLAYGYPQPTVFWYRGLEGTMVPFNDAVYEARGNVLLIRSLAIDTLGEYTCQAYNGEGKAASWVVSVQAYRPEGFFLENEYLVPRYTTSPLAKPQPPTTKETTTTTTTTTEVPMPLFTVPVNTHVSTPYSTLNVGTELRLTCEVDGFPEPDVYWTKDGTRIQTDGRITISGSTIVSRLSVSRLSVSDSGQYTCHASNLYSSHSDTAQINVQQQTVPAKCTDNPFFANCDLIVRSNFCRHQYYSKFCCKSCVEAGQLNPQEAELQADEPYRRK